MLIYFFLCTDTRFSITVLPGDRMLYTWVFSFWKLKHSLLNATSLVLGRARKVKNYKMAFLSDAAAYWEACTKQALKGRYTPTKGAALRKLAVHLLRGDAY